MHFHFFTGASVTTKIKRKEDAVRALTNCFTKEHIFVLNELLKQYRNIQTQILDVENELTEKILPYAHLVKELDKIPGIDKILAMSVIVEATADISRTVGPGVFGIMEVPYKL